MYYCACGSADNDPDRVRYAMTHREKFHGEVACVEMEGASIAHVCTRFGVPFLILRALSDMPCKGDQPLAFKAHLNQAAAMSAAICLELVGRLATLDLLPA